MNDLITARKFPLLVDYTRSLKKGIKAGKYGWVNPNINSSNFPFPGSQPQRSTEEVIMRLLSFNTLVTIKGVLARFKDEGLRPANLQELLAFKEQYDTCISPYGYVIAVGSKWKNTKDGNIYSPYFGHHSEGFSSDWYLTLCIINNYWFGTSFQFLGIEV